MKSFLITSNDAGQRLDKFLTKAVPLLPQNLMYKYLRIKRIKVNRKKSDISYRLVEGDCVELYINDEFFLPSNDAYAFQKAASHIEIIFEDENILLVNKPAGLVVHEDNDGTVDTLINRVLKYLFLQGCYDPAAENSFVPALCHRIDRNTAGLVLCAKNAATLRVLNEKIRNREISKIYRCLVFGVPVPAHAVKKAFLLKFPDQNRVQVFNHPVEGGRTAITEYTVLRHNNCISLLEVVLHTGRTHQIRAHLAYLGYPLVGDSKYGTIKNNQQLPYRFQALCAWKLVFDFPTDAEHLNYLRGKSFQLSQLPFSIE